MAIIPMDVEMHSRMKPRTLSIIIFRALPAILAGPRATLMRFDEFGHRGFVGFSASIQSGNDPGHCLSNLAILR